MEIERIKIEMKKYTVYIQGWGEACYEVEALDEQMAEKMALDVYKKRNEPYVDVSEGWEKE